MKIKPNDALLYQRFSPRPKKIRGEELILEPADKLDLQQRINREYCQRHGLIPRFIIDEPNTSARDLNLVDRPRGPEVESLFRAGIKHIVVNKTDRLFRSLRDGAYWLEEGFPELGITLHVASLGGMPLRMDTADGFLMGVMQLAMPQVEAMRTSERTSEAMLARQCRNERMGGKPPYGRMIDPANPDRLTDNPDEAPTLARIYALADQGYSAVKIARMLNQAGLATRKGTHWRHQQIGRILDRRPVLV